MKHSTRLLVIITAAVSTVAFAGAGWAFWATAGNGSASSRAGTLNPPTAVTPSSTAGSSTVAVTWAAPTGGVAPTGYYVYRTTGATTTAACTSPAALRPPTPTSCSDTGVPNGTYTYKVTAAFQSWTAQSAASGSVTVITDTTAPTLTTLQMFDTNTNGKVDRVEATFSETILSSSATGPWTLSNVPSGASLASVATSGAVAALTLTEGPGAPDTTVGAFTVALSANAGGIRDAVGNQSAFNATAPADKAAPVFVSMANGTGGSNGNGKLEVDDILNFNFSEPLAWTAPTSPAPVVTLTSGNGSNTDKITVNGLTSAINTLSTGYITGNNNVVTFPRSPTVTLANGNTTIRVTLGACTGTACGSVTATSIATSGGGTFVEGFTDAAGNIGPSSFTWTAFKFF